jgi:hypothetical protein
MPEWHYRNLFMPYVVQIFLPLYDNSGRKFEASDYADVSVQLTEKFGGLTAYSRAPAEGHWEQNGTVTRDDIVVFEVMTDALDRAWWNAFRRELESRFRQDSIVARAQQCEAL